MKENNDSLDAMLGAQFLKQIEVEDAGHILDALKKYGDDELIDKWVSVTLIAATVILRKQRKINESNLSSVVNLEH